MRRENKVDVLFGESVVDPYRHLEDGESEEVRVWTEAENQKTLAYVEGFSGADRLRSNIHDLLQIGSVESPAVRVTENGTRRYFHRRREGDAMQPVLLYRDHHDGTDHVLIDVDRLSKGGTDALDWWFPSPDGSLVAWGRSENGSEESVLHIRDVRTGIDLDERIPNTRYASVAWVAPDRFFYTRHPAKGDVPAGEEPFHGRVYEHQIGRDFSLDPCVFGEGRDKADAPAVFASPDGHWLVVRVHQGWARSEIYIRRASDDSGAWRPVATHKDSVFDPIAKNDALYLLTNDGAPRYRLIRSSWNAPTIFSDVIPEKENVLTSVAIARDGIVAVYLEDASSRVLFFENGIDAPKEISLGAIGSADVLASDDGAEVFVDFTSFVVPSEVFRLPDLPSSRALESWDRVHFETPSDIEVTRMFAVSKDGTRIPMFIVARRNSSQNPRKTLLSGYGGFNVNMTPAFSPRMLAFVLEGGVGVSAILRGGGEYGESWHRAGMLEHKQNVFDDFIACAETLVNEGITKPELLAILGGSNGGLLTAAVVTQRPELFRVALSLVPLCDMLRFHRFRLGAFWIPEYGSPEDENHFQFLYAYSPYHRVRDGVRYPAMLFTSAESDTRVDPLHARKMAARMQAVSNERPVLLFVESQAGHGQGKPISKVEDEMVMQLSFVLRELTDPK